MTTADWYALATDRADRARDGAREVIRCSTERPSHVPRHIRFSLAINATERLHASALCSLIWLLSPTGGRGAREGRG